MSCTPRPEEMVRLRVYRLTADHRPGALLSDQISEPSIAYETGLTLTREQGKPLTDEQWQQLLDRARRIVDEPAPPAGQAPVWVLAHKPSGILWVVTWPDEATEDEFGALTALEEQEWMTP